QVSTFKEYKKYQKALYAFCFLWAVFFICPFRNKVEK
ncbi:MAG: hypothetical protein ACJASR_001835, partial [Psychroserpens sp.]